MTSHEYMITAAIDFGTTFSGWAYSFKHEFTRDEPKIYVKNWNSGQYISPKAPTSVLIYPDGQSVVAFGYEAEDQFVALIEDGTENDYYFFQRFKMMLYKQKMIGRKTNLTDATGKILPALKVFELAIKYLKDDLLKASNTKMSNPLEASQIHWLLTVPAIWSERAKQFMREAAVNAGIDSKNLTIVLEPEAASVYCRDLRFSHSEDGNMVPLEPGDRYVVVDCGGGTVDICCHEITFGGHLKEISSVKGDALGGTSVDEAYVKMIEEIFGDETWAEFKKRYYGEYIEFMRQFEIGKRKLTPESGGPFTVHIPNTFVDVHKEITGISIKDKIINSAYCNDIKVAIGNKIRINANCCRSKFFYQVTQRLKEIIIKMFQDQKVKTSKAILLVGGFGESEIIQNCIIEACPNMRVIVPNEAGLVVIRGAVTFGYNAAIIEQRVVRYTYGKKEIQEFNDNFHNTEKIVYPDGAARVHAFKPLISFGQIVPENHQVELSTSVPVRDDQREICIRLYAVDGNNELPRVVDDPKCIKLGKLVVPISDMSIPREKRLFGIKFRFGGSEVSATVTEISSGNVTEGVFDFLG